MNPYQTAKSVLLALSLAATILASGAEARITPAALDRTQIQRLVVAEAEATSLPPSLPLALAKVESNFRGNALSNKGARCVVQIMPRTAREEFGVAADELWDPRLNIQLGLGFLEQLIERYGGRWDLALSHYNGGSLRGTGAEARAHGYNRPYVRSVLAWEKRYAAQSKVWRDNGPRVTSIKVKWTPARTVPSETLEHDDRVVSAQLEAESEAEAERRYQRRIRMIRKDRAGRKNGRQETGHGRSAGKTRTREAGNAARGRDRAAAYGYFGAPRTRGTTLYRRLFRKSPGGTEAGPGGQGQPLQNLPREAPLRSAAAHRTRLQGNLCRGQSGDPLGASGRGASPAALSQRPPSGQGPP